MLTDSLKETQISKVTFFWKPLYIVRWIMSLLTLIVLREKSSIQILCLFIFSVIYQGLIIFSKPYNSKSENYTSLFNEFSVSAYLYVLLLLTDYLDSSNIAARELLSWVLTSILMLAIFVNFLYTLINLSISAFAYFRKMRQDNTEELKIANIKYKQAALSIDVTRLEAESIVVDIGQGEKNLVPVKRRQERSIADFPDLFTI